jgi:hypothetical protein
VAAFVGNANLFEARIEAPGLLRTSIGPLHADTGSRRPGQRVVAMVRLEKVIPHPAPAADTRAPNLFHGKLVHDRFLGAVRRFDFRVNGGVIQGESVLRDPIDCVSIPPEAIRLLEPTATDPPNQEGVVP